MSRRFWVSNPSPPARKFLATSMVLFNASLFDLVPLRCPKANGAFSGSLLGPASECCGPQTAVCCSSPVNPLVLPILCCKPWLNICLTRAISTAPLSGAAARGPSSMLAVCTATLGPGVFNVARGGLPRPASPPLFERRVGLLLLALRSADHRHQRYGNGP